MRIAALEDYLVSRIKTAFNGRLRAVESLPADWDGDTFKRLLRQAPGAYVVFGGGPLKRSTPGACINAQVSVIAVTTHASGELARRRGDSREIGAYEILEIVVPLLHDHVIADVGALALIGVENLFASDLERQGAAVYGATFSVPFEFDRSIDPAMLDDFLVFHGDYDIVPADGMIDATDHVELGQ